MFEEGEDSQESLFVFGEYLKLTLELLNDLVNHLGHDLLTH